MSQWPRDRASICMTARWYSLYQCLRHSVDATTHVRVKYASGVVHWSVYCPVIFMRGTCHDSRDPWRSIHVSATSLHECHLSYCRFFRDINLVTSRSYLEEKIELCCSLENFLVGTRKFSRGNKIKLCRERDEKISRMSALGFRSFVIVLFNGSRP